MMLLLIIMFYNMVLCIFIKKYVIFFYRKYDVWLGNLDFLYNWLIYNFLKLMLGWIDNLLIRYVMIKLKNMLGVLM